MHPEKSFRSIVSRGPTTISPALLIRASIPPRTVATSPIEERTSDSFFTSQTQVVTMEAYLSTCRDRFSRGGAPADLLRGSRASHFLVLTVWPAQAPILAILLLSQRLYRQTNPAEPSFERAQMTIMPRLVQMAFSNSCSEVFHKRLLVNFSRIFRTHDRFNPFARRGPHGRVFISALPVRDTGISRHRSV
jgi:hypothetical protein